MTKSSSGLSENSRKESIAKKAAPTAAMPVIQRSGLGSAVEFNATSARPDRNRLPLDG